MSDYFSHDIKLQPGTKARAEDVNARFDAIVIGLNKLPAPHSSLPGFSEAVAVGDPTDQDHAVTAGQAMSGGLTYAVDTGAVNAFIVDLSIAPLSYTDGLRVAFKALNANTGASTINVNGLGIKQLARSNGDALVSGDIVAGQIVSLIYNGTKFFGITPFQGQLNEIITLTSGHAVAAAGSASSASSSAGIATTKAGEASVSATSASGSSGTATTQAGIATTKAGEASTSATNASNSAISTAADSVQTGLDRVATAADRVQTGLDRVQVNTDKNTATTQAGLATTQAGLATTQAGLATTQAGIATTQAGIATTQAGIATTQAGIATTQAGIATDKAEEAAASAAEALAGGGASGRKNYIINGNFDIWQRGVSQSTVGYKSVDRWSTFSLGTTFVTSQQTFTLGQTAVPGNPKRWLRAAVTSVANASNYCYLKHIIEYVRSLSGVKATLSFWAKADAAKNISVSLGQNFGSGGGESTYIPGIGKQLVALTTTWTKYTITFDVPSITAKTLGANLNDGLEVHFFFDAGAGMSVYAGALGQQSGTFDIAQVQLEEGEVATDFERRTVADELALCQRYYEKSYDADTYPGTGTSVGIFIIGSWAQAANTTAGGQVFYKVKKRAIPVVTAYTEGGISGQLSAPNSGGSPTGVVTIGPPSGQAGFVPYHNGTVSGLTTGQGISLMGHFTADAEL